MSIALEPQHSFFEHWSQAHLRDDCPGPTKCHGAGCRIVVEIQQIIRQTGVRPTQLQHPECRGVRLALTSDELPKGS